MHAAALGEGVLEVAGGAGDAVLGEVVGQAGRLRVRIVLRLPPRKVFATDACT